MFNVGRGGSPSLPDESNVFIRQNLLILAIRLLLGRLKKSPPVAFFLLRAQPGRFQSDSLCQEAAALAVGAASYPKTLSHHGASLLPYGVRGEDQGCWWDPHRAVAMWGLPRARAASFTPQVSSGPGPAVN